MKYVKFKYYGKITYGRIMVSTVLTDNFRYYEVFHDNKFSWVCPDSQKLTEVSEEEYLANEILES